MVLRYRGRSRNRRFWVAHLNSTGSGNMKPPSISNRDGD